ncbi:MFS transporter [Xanthobacter sp.]|uniref:MFS transporter n=1 Tax=Xanthobacter sp. TaxID=35809 RepID=UPI0025DD4C2C|nr:MFS transporter [Xanthobacter sp.]
MSAAASPAGTGGAGRSVIAALGVVQILTWGSSFYLLTVLAGPISRDTGWPLQWIVGSLSVGLLVAGLVSPKVGALIDARGGRPVLAGGCALLACGLALLALAQGPAMFMLGWCIAGAGMAASLYDAAFAALGRLYGAGARRAITMLTLWGGFASTVCWPITAFLDAHLGWRATCLVYAGLHLAVSIPLVLAFMPAIASRAEIGRPARGGPVVLGEPERISFLLMGGIVTLIGTIASAMSVQVLALLQSRGLSLAEAVTAGAFIGPSQVFARIIEQASGGRHHPLWTMIWAVALMGLGLVMLAAGFPIVAVALVAYGAGNGIFSIAKGTVPLAVLGADRYPVLAGRLARPALLAQALAPLGAAQLLAAWGAGAAFSALIGLWLAAAVLLAWLWRRV